MSPIIQPGYPDFSAGPLPATVRPPDTIEELNPRVLAITIIGLVLLLPAAFFWHQFQIYRNAGKLLTQAQRLSEQEEWREAATMYFHYLKLRPDDAQTWIKLAQSVDRAAKTYNEKQKAVELYFQTVTLASDQAELRRRLAELLLEQGKHELAEYQADKLLERVPEDASAWRTKALSSYWAARTNSRLPMRQVARWFVNAAKYNPHDVVMARGLAEIYRSELQTPGKAERDSYADTVMNKLVANNPGNVEALLSRYTYRVRFRLSDADPDLDRAIELAPSDENVLLTSAHRAMSRRDYKQAQHDYQRMAELLPTDPRGYLGWGNALARADLREEAIEVWRKGLKQVGPDDFWINLRLTEALVVLGRLEEASDKIVRLDDLISRQLRPGKSSGQERYRRQVAVDFVRARWFATKGDYYSAVPVLKRVLNVRQRSAETEDDLSGIVDVLYQLAQAYGAQEQHDLAASMFEEATQLQPTVADHYLNAAQAWEAAGQPGRAARAYELALVQKETGPAALILLARAQMGRQQHLPPAEQNWDEFKGTLARAKEKKADNVLLMLLEADYLSAIGQQAHAIALLESAHKLHPRNNRLAQALIMANEKWGRPDEADRLLAEFTQKDKKPSFAATMLRVAVLLHRGQFDEAQPLLQEAQKRGNEAERGQALFQLVHLDLRRGRLDSARTRLRDLIKSNSKSTVLWEMLAELASGAADWEESQVAEEKLRELEGPAGSNWRYFRALRLLETSKGSTDKRIEEAVKLQQEVQDVRPAWAQGHHLRGMVRERQEKPDEAIEAYQQAVFLGYQNLHTYQRLIALLQQRNRVAEADRYLARLIDLASHVPTLSTLAVTVSFQQGQLGRAVTVAEEAVRLRPDDPTAHTWLGTSLVMVGRADEGLRELEKANELAPHDPQTWIGLMGAQLRQSQTGEVKKLIERLAEAPLPPAVREFLAGQACELTDDADQAQRRFQKAHELAPDDTAILEHLAGFLQSRDPQQAETLLRRLVELAPDAETGKRRLAEFLAKAPGPKRWDEIGKLLKGLGATPDTLTPAALRDKARILVQRGGVDEVREAAELLAHLVRDSADVQPEDRLMLAWLYTQLGEWAKARDEYRELATQPEPSTSHLAAYLNYLLDQNYLTEAGSYLTLYEKADPEGSVALELRSRWLHLQDRDAEIPPLVEQFVAHRLEIISSEAQRAATYRLAAETCALVNLPAAEAWFRRWLELDGAACTPLAVWLASAANGRIDDALKLCDEQAAKDPSPAAAMAAAAALVLGNAEPPALERIEPLLTKALAAHSDHAELALWTANVRCMQNRRDEAIALYRRVLTLEPDHVDAHSNLALLLSESPEGRAEALGLVERAMDIAGRTVPLLDTYGVVLMRADRAAEAVELYRKLVTLTSAKASVHFHYAAACKAAGDGDSARKSLEQARKLQLELVCLTPGERQLLSTLDQELRK